MGLIPNNLTGGATAMNVAKFQEVGVNRLYSANTIDELNKFYGNSCHCCCVKNVPLDCEKCGIAFHHKLILTTFNNEEGASL